MVKKIRFQEIRAPYRRRGEPQEPFEREPAGTALLGMAVFASFLRIYRKFITVLFLSVKILIYARQNFPCENLI